MISKREQEAVVAYADDLGLEPRDFRDAVPCQAASIEYDPEHWMMLAFMEAIKTAFVNATDADWKRCITTSFINGEKLYGEVRDLVLVK